jgi:lysine-specific demethylase 8
MAAPSLEAFYAAHMLPGLPVILTGAIAHWPAMGCPPGGAWDDGSGQFGAVRRAAGHRTVPVEVGAAYTDDAWSQALMPLSAFLDRFVRPPLDPSSSSSPSSESLDPSSSSEPLDPSSSEPSSSPSPPPSFPARATGYLAQHELFRQCPELRRDVSLPEYCALLLPGEDAEARAAPVLNAWLGPGGTVSPAHYDPAHNLLAQVVGAKRVLLFSPADSPCLYPSRGVLNNTSSVDCDAPDLDAFPRFRDAVGFAGELAAGELLYIPPLWWHHIRALEPSFSVSFWWGKHWTADDPVSSAKPVDARQRANAPS